MRRPNLVAAALITIAALRIASTYTTFSLTTDEPVHIGAGLELLQQHTYTLQPVNPPLPRIVMAAIPSLYGMRWGNSSEFYQTAWNVFYGSDGYLTKLVLIRVGNLLFFVITAIALFAWTRLELGSSEAVLATFLLTTQPIILGYSGIANHDVPGAAGLAVALLAFAHWLRRPDAIRAAILGAAYGFSILCKFSNIPYVPAACAAIFVVRLVREPQLRRLRALATVFVVPFVAAVLIWAGYAFTFGPVPDMNFSAPAPWLFRGIGDLLQFDRQGFVSYAFGKLSLRGWWWYFPLAVLLKTTLPFLLLVFAGGWFAWHVPRLRWLFVESSLGALAILAVSLPSTLDLGVRYVLPLYVPLTLAATAGAVALLQHARKEWRVAAIGLLALQTVVSLAAHPDYFPYFNALAGDEPGEVLVDSNLDWGQDALRLKKAVRRMKIDRIGILTPGSVDYKALGVPQSYPLDAFRPQRGWIAVGEHFYRTQRAEKGWRWLEPYRVTHVGKSIRLYYIPPCEPQVIPEPELANSERILLPVAGTIHAQGAPGGARWQVDQEVRNRGKESVRLSLSFCAEPPQCDFDLQPGQTIRIAGLRPFIYVTVPRASGDNLQFSTTARRVDRQVPGSDVHVPAVRESQFAEGSIEIHDVPLSPHNRVNLRLYSDKTGSWSTATVSVKTEDGRVFDKTVPVYVTGYYTNGDVAKLFPELAGRDVKATVSIRASARLWAFGTSTDAEGRSTVLLPK